MFLVLTSNQRNKNEKKLTFRINQICKTQSSSFNKCEKTGIVIIVSVGVQISEICQYLTKTCLVYHPAIPPPKNIQETREFQGNSQKNSHMHKKTYKNVYRSKRLKAISNQINCGIVHYITVKMSELQLSITTLCKYISKN